MFSADCSMASLRDMPAPLFPVVAQEAESMAITPIIAQKAFSIVSFMGIIPFQ
jgi:hypothetical protein